MLLYGFVARYKQNQKISYKKCRLLIYIYVEQNHYVMTFKSKVNSCDQNVLFIEIFYLNVSKTCRVKLLLKAKASLNHYNSHRRTKYCYFLYKHLFKKKTNKTTKCKNGVTSLLLQYLHLPYPRFDNFQFSYQQFQDLRPFQAFDHIF